jgi:hypothetical protein
MEAVILHTHVAVACAELWTDFHKHACCQLVAPVVQVGQASSSLQLGGSHSISLAAAAAAAVAAHCWQLWRADIVADVHSNAQFHSHFTCTRPY